MCHTERTTWVHIRRKWVMIWRSLKVTLKSSWDGSCDSIFFPIVTYIRVKQLFQQEKKMVALRSAKNKSKTFGQRCHICCWHFDLFCLLNSPIRNEPILLACSHLTISLVCICFSSSSGSWTCWTGLCISAALSPCRP